MKKIALTVAILALGIAGCAKSNDADNMTANDMNTENAASTDMNASMNEATPENAAENALENASNAVSNTAGNSTSK